MMYQHTQVGWTMLAVFLAAFSLVAFLTISSGAVVLLAVLFALLLILCVLFHSLTVTVRRNQLQWYFGPGFRKKAISLDQIERVAEVRNRWYYGWGIRLTPHGWLYNVSGLSGVEISLKEGRRFRLGTDEPQALRRALEDQGGNGTGYSQ